MNKNGNTRRGKNLIFVDGSFQGYPRKSKIALYHKNIHRTLNYGIENTTTSNFTEEAAILNAIIYIAKHKLKGKTFIFSDNKSSVEKINKDPIFEPLLRHLSFELVWIPRELNQIADQTTKINMKKEITHDKIYHQLSLIIEKINISENQAFKI